jgi:hypothetical protein
VWFDENEEVDWRITSSEAAAAGFREELASRAARTLLLPARFSG